MPLYSSPNTEVNLLSWKEAVRAATTAALPANTAPTVLTLVASANGALAAQDGVTLIAGDRLLVKNEATTANNGIYIVTAVGSAGTPYVLTRSGDFDQWDLEIPSAIVPVEEGTSNADTTWICTSNRGGTLGTTAITFTQYAFGNVTAAANITDHSLIRGDGGAKGIQGSCIIVDDDAYVVPSGVTSRPLITVSRTVSDNSRTFLDRTQVIGSGPLSCNIFDMRPIVGTGGLLAYDHAALVQYRSTFSGLTLARYSGDFHTPVFTAGTTALAEAIAILDATGAGAVDYQRGVVIESLAKGAFNAPIIVEGSTTGSVQAIQTSIHHPAIAFGNNSASGHNNYQVRITPLASTVSGRTALGITGGSTTGSGALPIIDIAHTWNTSGNVTGIKLNVTNTASGASSLLMDLQVGGVSFYSVTKGGDFTAAGASSCGGGFSARYLTSLPAGGGSAPITLYSSGPRIHSGSGAPTVSSSQGSLYLRSNGSGVNDRAYINTDGGTTWTAIVTVA